MFKLKQYKALLQQMPDSSTKMQSLDLVKQVKRKSHLPPCELLPALASLLLELYFTKFLRGQGEWAQWNPQMPFTQRFKLESL